MPSRQEYRLRWLAKQLEVKDKVDLLLADLGVKTKTTAQQKEKVQSELSKLIKN